MLRTVISSALLLLALFPPPAGAQSPWVRATPQDSGMRQAPLSEMEAAVVRGDFKSITSVLVARHGRLVYEKYFDGKPGALRNTRSATKTITGMLLGIAIDRGRLPGVQAHLLDLVPARPKANSDPRKDRITVEDLRR